MTINGREYSEPELMAKIRAMVDEIKRLESEKYALSEKLGDIEKDYNEQATVIGFLEQDNERLKRENLKAKPVKRGRWIPQGDDMWLCSNCLENKIFSMHESDRTEKQRYCSRCGAEVTDGDVK